jgi:hypothetical protein
MALPTPILCMVPLPLDHRQAPLLLAQLGIGDTLRVIKYASVLTIPIPYRHHPSPRHLLIEGNGTAPYHPDILFLEGSIMLVESIF